MLQQRLLISMPGTKNQTILLLFQQSGWSPAPRCVEHGTSHHPEASSVTPLAGFRAPCCPELLLSPTALLCSELQEAEEARLSGYASLQPSVGTSVQTTRSGLEVVRSPKILIWRGLETAGALGKGERRSMKNSPAPAQADLVGTRIDVNSVKSESKGSLSSSARQTQEDVPRRPHTPRSTLSAFRRRVVVKKRWVIGSLIQGCSALIKAQWFLHFTRGCILKKQLCHQTVLQARTPPVSLALLHFEASSFFPLPLFRMTAFVQSLAFTINKVNFSFNYYKCLSFSAQKWWNKNGT